MTIYYIDVNRGSDANTGLSSSLAWQHLSKVNNLALLSGSAVLLASDSVFDIESDVGPYPQVWAGTEASPIVIGKFDPLSASTGKPLIRRKRTILVADWTYDAPNNGWWFQGSPSLDVDWGSWIRLGGEYGYIQDSSALPLQTINRCWKNHSSGKVYVYAPAGTNPTTYYGSVEFAMSARGSFSLGDSGTYVVFEDIDTADGGGLVWWYGSSGTRRVIVRRCSSVRAGYLAKITTEGSGLSTCEMYDCTGSAAINYYINAYGPNAEVIVHDNVFDGGSVGQPSGAIYLQNLGGNSRVYANHVTNVPFGTPLHPSDPGAIYCEVGSGNIDVYRNFLENCYCAFIDNSGRANRWYSNIVVNSRLPMQVSDLEAVGSLNCKVYHNTFVGCGNPALTPLAGPAAGGIGIYWYLDALTVDIRNNILSRHPDALDEPCFETGVTATGTIAKNSCYGFSSVAKTYLGGVCPITPTGTITADPLLTGALRLSQDSPAKNVGANIPGLVDYMGDDITDTTPDLGAYAGEEEASTVPPEQAASSGSSGVRVARVTTRTINLSAEIRRMWGKEWNAPNTEYEFSNGKTFKRRTQDAGIYQPQVSEDD